MIRQAASHNPGRGKVRVVTLLWWLVGCVMALAWLALMTGFLGRWWPLADSLSLLRPLLGVLCLLGACLRFAKVTRIALAGAAAAAALTILPLFVPGKGGDLRIYSKNMWYRNGELLALATDIIDSGAEVVMLQEVSDRNAMILQLLGPRYPHQHVCPFAGWSRIAVLSVHPIAETACSSRRAMAAARITRDGRAFWAASVHLQWPYPYGNSATADSAVDLLLGLDGPIVTGGDFNIFPWAASVQRMRRSGRMRSVTPLRPTFHLKGVPLFLDHVWAPGGGHASYRSPLGSDHLGILAVVDLDG
ncbi:endonuclease/exonuclease/phosphatase family protein [Yoonia sp. 2307UL14-13]|uniref:endonuclease/exonuclease/phosphatase family protein n=1 Tax=Yoonia sp. 2307UL14-13 TaxID=3126506 RepID=UPI0030B539FF